MKNKNLIFLFILSSICISTTSYAQSYDEIDEFNRGIVIKNLDVQDQNGKKITLTQKFLSVGGDELMYIKGSSSTATTDYAQKLCEQKGQVSDIEYGSKLILKDSKDFVLTCTNDKNIANTITNQTFALAPVKVTNKLYTDVITFNSSGEKIIERNAQLTAPSGKIYNTQQKFIELRKNKLFYIPNSSTPETLKYINDICSKNGRVEQINKGSIIVSENVAGAIKCQSHEIRKKI